tara:strand:- start:233 stop:1375 length:1143 start_codon:yes stop_codon:yes gene_type:complete
MQKKIFYWSPHINEQVATVKAVLNSAKSLSKYESNFKPHIINAFGEWNNFSSELNLLKIPLIKIIDLKTKLPINGFLKSRIFYIFFSIIIFFPLIKILKKEKPEFVIIHLITIPVLFASIFLKDIKFILRISGFPKLNLFRRCLWKLLSKNIFKIFTPTLITKDLLIKKKIFDKNKIFLLEDPIIEIRKITKLKKQEIIDIPKDTQFIISIGRLTRQKNFEFLIESYNKMKNELKNLKLLIIGSGEELDKLTKLIKKYHLGEDILIKDFKKNIFNYLDKAYFFIMTSNMEDPGFVIIEAAYCNKFIISSDVNSGPKEFVGNQKNGFLYKKNNFLDFKEKIVKFLNLSKKDLNETKIRAKIKTKNYTIFNHYRKLKNYLEN